MVESIRINTPNPIGNYRPEIRFQNTGTAAAGADLKGLIQLAKQGTFQAEKMKSDNSIQFDSAVEGPRKTYSDSAKLLDGFITLA